MGIDYKADPKARAEKYRELIKAIRERGCEYPDGRDSHGRSLLQGLPITGIRKARLERMLKIVDQLYAVERYLPDMVKYLKHVQGRDIPAIHKARVVVLTELIEICDQARTQLFKTGFVMDDEIDG